MLEGSQSAILLLRQFLPDLVKTHWLLDDLLVGWVHRAIYRTFEQLTLVLASHLVKLPKQPLQRGLLLLC